MQRNELSRRRLLSLSLAGATLLAGCATEGSEPSDGAAETTTADTTTAETTTTTESDADARIRVGPNGEFVFDPGTDEPARVAAGATVRWVWESGGHSIVTGEQPEDADWQGTEPLPGSTYEEGYTYEYTFSVPGTYQYECGPHSAAGMVGTLVVEEP